MTTIKPLQSLALRITDGVVSDIPVILGGNSSLHHYSLKPSDAQTLRSADIIFCIDRNMETFIRGYHSAVELSQNIKLLPQRKNSKQNDLHVWLSHENAKQMVFTMLATLQKFDPHNSMKYAENAHALIDEIDCNKSSIKARIEQVPKGQFMVFHDAYRYFEDEFDLKPALVNSIKSLGLRSFNQLLNNKSASCVIIDPTIKRINIEGKKIVTLDPLGANIQSGRDAFFQIINNVSDGFIECLTNEEIQ